MAYAKHGHRLLRAFGHVEGTNSAAGREGFHRKKKPVVQLPRARLILHLSVTPYLSSLLPPLVRGIPTFAYAYP